MAKLHGLRALLPAAALLLGLGAAPAWVAPAGAASVGTPEYAQFVTVWLQPGFDRIGPGPNALLNLPAGWTSGDVIVVLAPGNEWPPGARDRLVGMLLDAGAGVMELNPFRRADPRPEIAAALRAAHRDFGAGLAVLIGRGASGAETIEAAADAVTPEGRRFAAAVRLGPGLPDFVFGAAPAAEAWPARAPLFCEVLARAQLGDGHDIGTACRSGLAMLR